MLTLWLIVIGMGLITYALRLGPLAALDHNSLPPLLRRGLEYVPPAVLSAIIFPELLRPAGYIDLSLANERLLAGLIAVLVAWRTRNVLLTIVLGAVALWLLQLL
ncbi:MAG: AzlD domain-containing protein [bacterium]